MTVESAVYEFGPYVLDRPRRLLTRDGAPVGLTPKAFDLLSLLVENGGRVVSKETLMSALWPDTVVEESNLTFQISTLRKALSDGRYVVTIPGRGYQFAGAVQRQNDAIAPVETETIVEDGQRMTITVSERRVAWPWIAAAAIVIIAAAALFLTQRTPRASAPGVRSIAVLPFRPLVAAHRDESLELGMADTLITRLSHIPGIVVSPTSAVRRYSKLDQDPLAAGRELGVETVLDGSIQRSGERMRVTVRLLRTADGEPLWASQFDEGVRDLFAVQDRVADGVAHSIASSLTGREQQLLAKKTTSDLAAYDLYIKGLFLKERDGPRAREFFQRALERDPKFAAAWAAIAEAWLFHGRFTDLDPRQPFENARIAAEKAIALDPDLAAGHAVLASVYGDYQWRWEDAEREYQRALELNPNDAMAHAWYSALNVFRRKFDLALEHSRRAVELDPLSPVVLSNRGMILRFSGRSEEAIRHLEEALRLHRNLTPLLLHLGMTYTNAGKTEQGMNTLRDAMSAARSNSQTAALYAYAAAKAGKRDEALRVIRELEAGNPHESLASINLAIAWTALGDHDRAFTWLERAYEKRVYLLRVITVEPGFAPLRSDPRYADLVRRMGL
ncbi:MAG: winged helix-turn-helix domain-containing protein [Acidobacteriota bacterium]|nr:winged helix-turn-helix domain-containing protein [Acidobacteriota bacterium]